jgi:hypothetical protein
VCVCVCVFEAVTRVLVNIVILWLMTPRCLVNSYH